MKKIFVVLMAILLFGCVQSPYYRQQNSSPVYHSYDVDLNNSTFEDKDIKLQISPHYQQGGTYYHQGLIIGFNLIIENRTNSDITIDWGNTYFLENGKPNS